MSIKKASCYTQQEAFCFCPIKTALGVDDPILMVHVP